MRMLMLTGGLLTLAGCAQFPQDNTTRGAAIGAVVGAVAGKATGNHKDKRLVIGAAVGAFVPLFGPSCGRRCAKAPGLAAQPQQNTERHPGHAD